MSKIVKAEPEELALVEVPTGGSSAGGCGGDPPGSDERPLSAAAALIAAAPAATPPPPAASAEEAPVERLGSGSEALPGMPNPEGGCRPIDDGERPLAMVANASEGRDRGSGAWAIVRFPSTIPRARVPVLVEPSSRNDRGAPLLGVRADRTPLGAEATSPPAV